MESAQRFVRALDTAAEEVELLEVAVRRAFVHVVMVESLFRVVRKVLQVALMPVGIRGLAVEEAAAAEDTDDWAKAIDVNKETIAKDFIILTRKIF